MIGLEVTIENDAVIETSIAGLASQIPFAASKAINLTVNNAQSAVQSALDGEFHLRRKDYVQRTIYRKPGQDFATKANLAGTVRVNPDRNILAKFEDGGEKTSIAGKSLAVPIFRQASPNIIVGRGDPLSVKMLMAAISQGHGKLLRARVRKGRLTVSEDPNKVFLAKTSKGSFIIQRTGPGSLDTRVLYAFERQVPIPASLHFEEIAMEAALEHWEANVTAAINYAIETMR